MLGPRAGAFDDDGLPDDNDDEDLKNDPISQMDMTVRPSFFPSPFYIHRLSGPPTTLQARGVQPPIAESLGPAAFTAFC